MTKTGDDVIGRACRGAPAVARPVRAALALAIVLVVAACDEFSSEGVAQTCVREAIKAGEPYGNDGERRRTEEQLRQYCRAAAEGR